MKQQRRDLWLVAALFFVALTLGGGGWHAPALVGVIEAVAFAVLLRFGLFADHGDVGAGAVVALLLIGALLLVGLLQLVPLPPAVWQALPGRTLLASSLALQGMPDARWGISLMPQATRLSLMMMLPPIAMFVAVIHLGWNERRLLCGVVGVAAGLSAVLSMFQIAAGDSPAFNPYGLPPFGLTVGFFANRNHQALFLDCAILVIGAIGLADPDVRRSRALMGGLALLPLALCVLGTASRSGVALLAAALLALLFLAALVRRRTDGGLRRVEMRRSLRAAALVAVAVVALVAVFGSSYQGQRLVTRFEEIGQDGRRDFWPDVLYVARLYAPVGAGFGSFPDIYDSAEPLASVNIFYVVHAHNDYVELFIECGVAALALVGGFLLWFLWRAVAAWRVPIVAPGAVAARAASVVVLLVLLHSLVDYPLRTEAIATLFAFACGLLVPHRTMARTRGERRVIGSAGRAWPKSERRRAELPHRMGPVAGPAAGPAPPVSPE